MTKTECPAKAEGTIGRQAGVVNSAAESPGGFPESDLEWAPIRMLVPNVANAANADRHRRKFSRNRNGRRPAAGFG